MHSTLYTWKHVPVYLWWCTVKYRGTNNARNARNYVFKKFKCTSNYGNNATKRLFNDREKIYFNEYFNLQNMFSCQIKLTMNHAVTVVFFIETLILQIISISLWFFILSFLTYCIFVKKILSNYKWHMHYHFSRQWYTNITNEGKHVPYYFGALPYTRFLLFASLK